MAGLVSIAALARVLSRRSRKQPSPAVPRPPEEDPAEAWRQRLSETRVPAPEASSPLEPTATSSTEASSEPKETLDERRARIHAKAQEAIDAMQEEPPA